MPKINADTVVEHRERTLEALLDALDALVDERGFEAVSMRDIAERAGLARTAIYNYAPDKETLLAAAATRDSAAIRSAVVGIINARTQSPAECFEAIVEMLVGTFSRSTRHLLVMRTVRGALSPERQAQAIGPFRDDVEDHLLRLLRDAIATGEFGEVDDLALTFEFVVAVLDTAVNRAAYDPSGVSDVATATGRFLRRALAARSRD